MSLTSLVLILSRNYCKKIVPMTKVQLVPPEVRCMNVLAREKFARTFEVPVIKVSSNILSKVTKICREYFLKVENFKPVQSCGEDNLDKCIYLNPEIITEWIDISKENREMLEKHNVNEKDFSKKQIQLSYENWKSDAIFKAILPESEETVSGFSQIGHIIHLNLRDHLLDYRYIIGEVLVDKIKTCRTVVNKSNVIDNTYRNFSMEVIAGEEDFLVKVKENQCNFQFDFSKVYWNPRLCKEHERILSFLKQGDVLFDVFCGVGPFAIPAAKKKCLVYANDLNPESFKWLNHNAECNKLNMYMFKSYNLDGKDFIIDIFKKYLVDLFAKKNTEKFDFKIHITMNLPALAVEFLKYYKGLLTKEDIKRNIDCDIILYVYCFATGDDADAGARELVNKNFECDMSQYILEVFNVRNVSPKKEMMRVTIKLTTDILCTNDNVVVDEPPAKKSCIS